MFILLASQPGTKRYVEIRIISTILAGRFFAMLFRRNADGKGYKGNAKSKSKNRK